MTVMPSVILPEAIQNNIFEEVKMPNMIKKSLSLPKNDEKKSHFVEWCLDTSTHGLPNVIKADNWILKIIWIILILTAVAGCLYFIITSFQTYFAYGVTTAYTNVYESPANFPAITICNLEAFDTYANLNLIQSILNKNGMNITITPSNQSPGINQLRIITNYLKAYFISNTTSNQTYLQSIGFTINSLLISCYFNNQPCSESDFSWFYDFNYGNCYTFNSNTTSIKKTSKAGPTYGLQLELFTGIPGYQDLLASERGIYLAVTNNSASPLTSYDGIKLSVGQATNIRVKRTFVSNLDSPFSDCRMDTTSKFSSDNSLYKRTLELNQYSLQLCYDLCLQKLFTMPTCNCSDPSLPQYDKSLSICNTNSKLSCANQVRDRFDSSSISDSCSSYCPPPCNYATYDTLVSSSSYPTSYYYNNILASTPNLQTKFKGFSLNETIVKESVLKVNIFYDSLNYITLIDSQTVTISTLFGTVGGQLGLFLGMSILTLFELLDLIYLICKNMSSRKK